VCAHKWNDSFITVCDFSAAFITVLIVLSFLWLSTQLTKQKGEEATKKQPESKRGR